MTTEEEYKINHDIAAHCEWESLSGDSDYNTHWRWRTPSGEIVADPTDDLNAMAIAEETLNPSELAVYIAYLDALVQEESTAFLAYTERASANQRARVFATLIKK